MRKRGRSGDRENLFMKTSTFFIKFDITRWADDSLLVGSALFCQRGEYFVSQMPLQNSQSCTVNMPALQKIH